MRTTVAAACLLVAAAALAQSPRKPATAAGPSLPGAVTAAPDWLKSGGPVPFDLKAYFAAPPAGRNAAPLYLDAIAEFGTEMAVCFPAGPERDRRDRAAKGRYDRFLPVYEAFGKDPAGVTTEQLDEVCRPYDEGFAKLAAAQKLPECVFQAGLGVESLLPHAQSARQVVRVVQLRVERDLRRGAIDPAIDDVATVLRLVRDLRPRGHSITQLVSIAIENVLDVAIIPPILAAPGLKVEHTDRLLKLLAEHEAKALEPLREALKAEYITWRAVARDLAGRNADQGKNQAAKAQRRAVELLLGAGGQSPRPADVDEAVKALGRPSAADYQAATEELTRFYRTMDALVDRPFAGRLAQARASAEALTGDRPLTKRIAAVLPATDGLLIASARDAALLRGTIALVALKRWELTGHTAPADLDAVAKAARLKSVPIDPYDGRPLRLASIDGRPVIYSIGQDGRDDGARVDSKLDAKPPGDMLFRLPEVRKAEPSAAPAANR